MIPIIIITMSYLPCSTTFYCTKTLFLKSTFLYNALSHITLQWNFTQWYQNYTAWRKENSELLHFLHLTEEVEGLGWMPTGKKKSVFNNFLHLNLGNLHYLQKAFSSLIQRLICRSEISRDTKKRISNPSQCGVVYKIILVLPIFWVDDVRSKKERKGLGQNLLGERECYWTLKETVRREESWQFQEIFQSRIFLHRDGGRWILSRSDCM